MVGGGSSRRDEGSLGIKNTNVFAALETLKKKKSDKGKGGLKSGKSKSSTSSIESKGPEPSQVFWAPAPLNSKSWADVDDDEDDDYYATSAPPSSVWGLAPQGKEHTENAEEESESEDDILDGEDDDVEDEHDYEPEVAVHLEPVMKPAEIPAAKETERQLSKKERRKKELAELEALLADFGVGQQDTNGQDRTHNASLRKEEEFDERKEKKESAPGDSKISKKKKKAREPQQKSNSFVDVSDKPEVDNTETKAEKPEEEESAFDMKERLKKITSMKKKKSSKEIDSAAKAAAQEAAARRAKLAAAKKKEKNHYNQQPVR
ncbi:hypothetical protein SAY87_006695 [Trapa incisa]|uniref:Uncharacterized protein n=1 Tax=Trapa incisa TaxID=236973 RepID=A0AAN7JWW5_9MYRT|nr:hypothetical protein SAY87_006695 [Trapa incisa]